MKRSLFFIFLISCIAGCKKFVSVDPPVDKIITAQAFADDATATATVTGIYSLMQQNYSYFGSFALSVYPGLYSDELKANRPGASDLEIQACAVSTANGVVYDNWRTAYKYIYQANACLEGVGASKTLSDSVRKGLEGEALFVRAFIHFYLVNLYGDIPLVTSTVYSVNAGLPRAKTSDVYTQVIADLLKAESLLPPSYGTGKARPCKWAAAAMLARVYLYLGQWDKAEAAASEVISSGQYFLSANLNNVFLSNSTETIWQTPPVVSNINTYEGNQFNPIIASLVPNYSLTDSLLGAFEIGDGRRSAWVKTVSIGGVSYSYPYKYKVRTASTVSENSIYLRLAELYLIRSEARARQGKIPEAQADLNTIRARAGLPSTTASDEASLLNAITRERRIEFFSEWGHRFFDLKRWGGADAALSYKPGWQPTDTLWPVPYAEIKLNPSLTQNPGY